MKLTRKKGATSQILELFIQDSASTTGAGKTGLAHDTASLTAYYHRNTAAAAVAISLVDMTVGTFTSSGFKEVDSTNMPGVYQLCVPNAAFLTGADSFSVVLKGATGMAPLPLEVQLAGTDLDSIVADFWNYATASAGAVTTVLGYLLSKLGLITAGSVTFTSPVDPDTGNLTIFDQDYTADSGITRPSWSSTDWTPFDLSAAASITLVYRTRNGAETAFGTMEVVSDTEVRLATLTRAQAQALPYGRGAAGIIIRAVLSAAKGDDVVELVNAKLNHFNFRALDGAP